MSLQQSLGGSTQNGGCAPHKLNGGGGGAPPSYNGGSAPHSLPDRFNNSPGPTPNQGRHSLPPDMRMVSTPPIAYVHHTPPPSRRGRGSPSLERGRSPQEAPPPSDHRAAGMVREAKKQMLSRNINGTFVMTTQPTNESELQLYRVLQRANLLHYYDTFISQGGDDVQQLCEAGEEEFLEIMALVGMASKPLHVRRLQKALQEWVQNPGLFQTPLVSSLAGFHSSPAAAAAAVIRASGGVPIPTVTVAPSVLGGVSVATSVFGGVSSPHIVMGGVHPPSLVPSSVSQLLGHTRALPLPSASPPLSQPPRPLSCNSPAPKDRGDNLRLMTRDTRDSEGRGDREGSIPSPSPSQGEMSHPGGSTSPLQLTPILMESQIQRIADTACALVKSLPDLEPKQPNAKKKICKELEYVMGMTEEDHRKMDEIRKFSAIYGRFDCKRKPEKPLTLHEVSVNEAAAQICRLVPAMLTRRDELFPLARQVVRDSGYQYSKGHSRSTFSLCGKLFNGEEGPFKRMRFSEDSEITQRRRERLDQISEESRLISDRVEELRSAGGSLRVQGDLQQLQQISQQLEMLQTKQQQLYQERDEHQRYIRYSSRMSTCSDPDRGDTDDETSQRSYSNASSPSASHQGGPHNFVLSASGGQIIAVQNPALSLSGAFSAGGRGSPPITVHSHSTPPLHSSPGFKQEPSSPPPYHHASKD